MHSNLSFPSIHPSIHLSIHPSIQHPSIRLSNQIHNPQPLQSTAHKPITNPIQSNLILVYPHTHTHTHTYYTVLQFIKPKKERTKKRKPRIMRQKETGEKKKILRNQNTKARREKEEKRRESSPSKPDPIPFPSMPHPRRSLAMHPSKASQSSTDAKETQNAMRNPAARTNDNLMNFPFSVFGFEQYIASHSVTHT